LVLLGAAFGAAFGPPPGCRSVATSTSTVVPQTLHSALWVRWLPAMADWTSSFSHLGHHVAQ
jgi:hypothetical protein